MIGAPDAIDNGTRLAGSGVAADLMKLAALEELKKLEQWVAYRIEESGGKPTKVPYNPWNGFPASVTKPDHWGDYDQASTASQLADFAGLGFVFTQNDPYAGVDLDECRDPETGVIATWAKAIIDRLSSYTEVSPSGCGVKIWLRGKVPGGGRKKGNVEAYSERRYFTFTGQHVPGTPTNIEERQGELDGLLEEAFGPAITPTTSDAAVTGKFPVRSLEPQTGVVNTVGDEKVLGKAFSAQNSDKFRNLWEGRWQQYSEYPSQSEADMGLCAMLAYWTDGDRQQIDRLFRQSCLMRDKWDERRGHWTYGQMTIQRALAGSYRF